MKLKITVHGVAYEVDVEVLDPGEGFAPVSALPNVQHAGPRPAACAPAPSPASVASSHSARQITAPIAGTVVEIKCAPGERVAEGQVLLVIEAMKMNTSITSSAAGTIKRIPVAAGDTVREAQTLVEFE